MFYLFFYIATPCTIVWISIFVTNLKSISNIVFITNGMWQCNTTMIYFRINFKKIRVNLNIIGFSFI